LLGESALFRLLEICPELPFVEFPCCSACAEATCEDDEEEVVVMVVVEEEKEEARIIGGYGSRVYGFGASG